DWGIGSEGTQQVVLKADRKHFRDLTAGAAVLVGRRTLGDFPNGAPLKGAAVAYENGVLKVRTGIATVLSFR
ncbi:MAG: dihydrofolate reductase, partial [Kiritimatiellae bacterium]|nr:dihydrofolate reductase [Kiritimatiellia bacterium]